MAVQTIDTKINALAQAIGAQIKSLKSSVTAAQTSASKGGVSASTTTAGGWYRQFADRFCIQGGDGGGGHDNLP